MVHLKPVCVVVVTLSFLFAKVANANEMAHWSFDDCSATIVNDSSPNGNHGTIPSESMWTSPGCDGTGCALSFSPPQHVTVPHDDSLNFEGSIYLSAWVNWVPIATSSAVICKGVSSQPYAVLISPNGGLFAGFNYNTGGTRFYRTTADGDVPNDGECHHIEVSYDEEYLRMYVDEELKWEEQISIPIVNNAEELYIGYDPLGGVEYYEGEIDEVIIATAKPAPVPAVSEWGLIVMSLLALTAGTLVYARRRPTPA